MASTWCCGSRSSIRVSKLAPGLAADRIYKSICAIGASGAVCERCHAPIIKADICAV